MPKLEDHVAMISLVARTLGPDECMKVVFVGGCTTALLLTDTYATTQVRHTEDVDLIVHVPNQLAWYQHEQMLRSKGFKTTMVDDDSPICAMNLNGLRVDFMPDDPAILSFSNSWYPAAYKSANKYTLPDGTEIRLIEPVHFIATKLEAYKQRGNNDLLLSQDIEDILTLADGRTELLDEVQDASQALRHYLHIELEQLQAHRDFKDAAQTAANGDPDRVDEILRRIKMISSFGKAT